MGKKELAYEYLNMFLYISLCVCLSVYIHAHTHKEKKVTKSTHPKLSCKKLNVQHEKVTSGAWGRRKHY